MRFFIHALAVFVALAMFTTESKAQSDMLNVTVMYRERIALPPDAELEVQLLDVSRADAGSKRLSSQRYAMTGVPQTVDLQYDSQIIEDMGRYAVVATIWSSDDNQLFRTTSLYSVFEGAGTAQVELVLTMVAGDGVVTAPPRTISGIEWAVTDVAGEKWSNDDPATLVIDDQMNFAMFGGCNRFVGQVFLADGEIAFPENFAGTMMACPGEAEALERTLLETLRKVSGYVRYGTGLVMTDADGNGLLHFKERPE
jgi:putative lipoprotein